MWNGSSGYKKFINIAFIIFIIIISFCINLKIKSEQYYFRKVCYAENIVNSEAKEKSDREEELEKEVSDKIEDILGDIDSSELDDFIDISIDIDFISSNSFIDIVKSILNNNYFGEYKSLFSQILNYFFVNIKEVFVFFFIIFVLVVINQIFDSFCEDKYKDFKIVINIIFSLVIALQIMGLLKDISSTIEEVVSRVFSYTEKLFPILLSLILISGANGTHAVYSTLASFLMETGMYLFKFVLFPIVSSIIILSVLSISFKNNKFSKLIILLKSIFKCVLVCFFAILGIFSTINMFSSGVSDGVNYKLTKFALKSYIPIIGGYISDGFDFVHTCSVLVKNAFGLCGIIVLFFTILKPFIVCIVYIFMFKILSVLVSFVGKEKYANYFEGISSSFTYYLSILIGIFMCIFCFIFLLILSVSVVWWFIK